MRTLIKSLIIVAILSFPITRALSQLPTQPPTINVSGSAEVKVAPDEVDLKVGVETRAASLEDATHDNAESISNSLAFLRSCGVKDKDVQTDFISIEPNYDNDYSSIRAKTYIVRRSISVKLTRVDMFEKVLTGLLTHGVNTVQGISFQTSELRQYRDKARAMAVRAAKEKAEAMASELGIKVGKVYNVNVNDGGGWWDGMGYWGGGFAGARFQNAMQNVGGETLFFA